MSLEKTIYLMTFFFSGYTNTSSMGYTQVTSSLFTPISTNLGLNQASTYSNAGLGSLGSSMGGALGSGDAFSKYIHYFLMMTGCNKGMAPTCWR